MKTTYILGIITIVEAIANGNMLGSIILWAMYGWYKLETNP